MPDETFDTGAPLRLARQPSMMRMVKKARSPPREIVIHSSNIGSVQLALRVSDVAHYDFMEKLGFTQRLQFELPETGAPLMPVRGRISSGGDLLRSRFFRHAVACALVAGAAMVNGGVLYPLRLTPTDMPVGTCVISEPTSLVLRDMMRDRPSAPVRKQMCRVMMLSAKPVRPKACRAAV